MHVPRVHTPDDDEAPLAWRHAALAALLAASFILLPTAMLLVIGRNPRPVQAQGGAATTSFPAPLNFGFDGAPYTSPLRISNWDYEAPPESVGSPPSNYEFTSGLTDWTKTGTVTAESSACESGYGDCIKLNSFGATLVNDDWFSVPSDAQFITVRYRSQGQMALFIQRQGTTQLTRYFPSSSDAWVEGKVLATPDFVGKSIKIKVYKNYGTNPLYVDHIGPMIVTFPGWSIGNNGVPTREEHGTPADHYALFDTNSDNLTSEQFTIPEDAQYMIQDVYRTSSSVLALSLVGIAGASEEFGSGAPYLLEVGWNLNVTWTMSTAWRGETTQLLAWTASPGTGVGIDRAVRFYQPLPGWLPVNIEEWDVEADGPFGRYAAHTDNDGDVLVSSVFVVPADAPRATYWYAQDESASSHSVCVVVPPADPYGGTCTSVVSTVSGVRAWQQGSMDLSAWEGEEIRLRFVVDDNVYLDEIAANLDERYCPPCRPSVTVGDPIDSATGAFSLSRTDYSIPAVGVDLDFRRRYLARGAFTGTLGYRWISNWDWRIERVESNGSVFLRYADGALHYFPYSSGFGQEDDSNDRLARYGSPGSYTYTLTTRGQLMYDFNTSGKLAAVRDRNGNSASLDYNAGGLLDSVTVADDRSLTFTYTDGLLTEVGDPLGHTVQYGYERSGMAVLETVTNTLGQAWTYAYDRDRLASETDPRGEVTFQNQYDETSRVVAQTDADGHMLNIAYATPGEGYTTLTRADGVPVEYEYDSHFRTLTETLDTGGLNIATAWEYDDAGRQAFYTRTATISTFTEYDDRGNLERRLDPVGRESVYEYTALNDVQTATLPAGRTVVNQYDDANLAVTTETITHPTYAEPLELVTSYERSPNGQVTQLIGPRRYTTTYAYDPHGYPTVITHHLGAGQVVTRAFEYNDVGWLRKEWDGLGHPTEYEYDGAGRVVTTTNALGGLEVRDYDEVGNLTSVADELGRTTRWAYNGTSRVISTTSPMSHTVLYGYAALGNRTGMTETISAVEVTEVYTYDAASRLVAKEDGEGAVTEFGYDEASRLESVTDPETGVATTTAYDGADRPISVTDGLGHTTAFTYTSADYTRVMTDAEGNATVYDYDPLGRLLSVFDAENQLTQYEFDVGGNRTKLIDANGHERTYAYDGLNRRTAMSLIESPQVAHATRYGYNPNGQVISRTDAMDQLTEYAYDQLGRLETVDYAGATGDVSYSYDAASNRRSMSNGSGATGYTYDDLDRVEAVVYTATATIPITVAYGYDEVGHRTRLTYPDDDEVTYTYDRAGRMKTVEDWSERLTTYDYDAAGKLVTTTLPNGVTSAYGYDDARRLITITHEVSSTILAQFVHTLDDVGNREARTGPDESDFEDYTYDDTYRLTGVVYSNDDETTYTYDAVSNREMMVEVTGGGTVTTTYDYDPLDRLTDLVSGGGPVDFDWDDNGNQVAKGDDDYSYDVQNRMIEAVVDGSSSAYLYNGDGVRLSKVVTSTGTVTTDVAVDVINELPVVLDDETYKYVYGSDLIAEVDSDDSPLYYLADGIGSTVGLVDGNGVHQQAYSYDAFGAIRTQVGGELNDFTFTGEQREWSSQHLFLRARSYDSEVGRFTTRDPVEGSMKWPSSLNAYSYVAGNPISFVDPSGLYPQPPFSVARMLRVLALATCPLDAFRAPPFEVGVGGQWEGFVVHGAHGSISLHLDSRGNVGVLWVPVGYGAHSAVGGGLSGYAQASDALVRDLPDSPTVTVGVAGRALGQASGDVILWRSGDQLHKGVVVGIGGGADAPWPFDGHVKVDKARLLFATSWYAQLQSVTGVNCSCVGMPR